MMEDRELLEMAAKAAELEIDEYAVLGGGVFVCGEPSIYTDERDIFLWNPIICDGDSFRLMNKLVMSIEHSHPSQVTARRIHDGQWFTALVNGLDDYDRATRLAIVMVAAEVGKSMQ